MWIKYMINKLSLMTVSSLFDNESTFLLSYSKIVLLFVYFPSSLCSTDAHIFQHFETNVIRFAYLI